MEKLMTVTGWFSLRHGDGRMYGRRGEKGNEDVEACIATCCSVVRWILGNMTAFSIWQGGLKGFLKWRCSD